jgi:hypothetical protein
MVSPYEDGAVPLPADTSIFSIKEIRPICRARTLRLMVDDVIIAVECVPFKGDIELFLDVMFECDPDHGVMLTIFRDGALFHVIARGPLGCDVEYAKPEQAEAASKKLAETKIEPREKYRIFEVLRDINRKCVIIDTQPSTVAMIASPIWLIQNRLWEVLLAVILIYGATLTVSWMLFVIAFILLALYFKQSQITLQRSFNLMRQRQMWMVVAATSIEEVQRACRQVDPKTVFNPSFVGPPAVDEAPAKKRRRRRPDENAALEAGNAQAE